MIRAAILIPLILMSCSLIGRGRDHGDTASRGAICNSSTIRGEVVGQVEGNGGCGIANAVKVYQVGGVPLSQPAVLECATARTLNRWVERDMDQIIGIMGGGVQQIKVAAHYACRTRNHQSGARLSEHAKGKAIDISGFLLKDGTEISVEEDWGRKRKGRVLRRLHKSACGPFGTVLGPESDRFHKDHFHFDTAKHGNGSYCR